MKSNTFKTRILVILCVLVALVILGRFALARCPTPPDQGSGKFAMHIDYLYPWPQAKIPFMCQTWAFIKSPFGPDMTYVNEEVLKEDGYPILGGHYREGAIVVRIVYIDENYWAFREDIEEMKLGTMPAFAKAVSIYIDGKKLEIGYIGYRGFDSQFIFATILNPFLWPGEHVGKIVILLPSGETVDYEWKFEITYF